MAKILDENSLRAIKTYVDEKDALSEKVDNKVTSLSDSSTDTQYPSAKCVYDALIQKQNKLVSGTNIKTINGQSILGSGNLPVNTSTEWGSIGGDIADQTDLQDEFQEVREIAEGKCKTYVLTYTDTIANIKSSRLGSVGKFFVYNLTTKELEDKTTNLMNGDYDNLEIHNSQFNNNDFDFGITNGGGGFIVFGKNIEYNVGDGIWYGDRILYINDETFVPFKKGDIFYVSELEVPDRWFLTTGVGTAWGFMRLETSKVNLDNYSTKSETSTEVNKVAHDIASEYDENTLYGIGDLCIKDKLLYKCNTNNTTGTWDSTKWDLTTVNSELGIIKSDIQHIANKFLGEYIGNETLFTTNMKVGDIIVDTDYGGKYVITEITFSGDTLTKVILNGQDDTGDPMLHIYDNSTWSSVSFGSEYVTLATSQVISGRKNFTYAETVFNEVDCSMIATRTQSNRLGIGTHITVYEDMIPSSSWDLGGILNHWNHLYLNGSIRNNNSSYGITLPNMSSWTTDKEIATTDQITPQWFGTQAQYDALGTYDSNTIYNILES